VYCDFGYFDGLLTRKYDRFAPRLAAAFKKYPNEMPKRCCYGTDWSLMMVESDANRYPLRFEAALNMDADVAQQADAIFWRNARDYLNLPGFLARSGAQLGGTEKQQIQDLIKL
jgi:hypothetical protein